MVTVIWASARFGYPHSKNASDVRKHLLFQRGLQVLDCDNFDEAKINCDNYGGAITFDLAISGEKKETIAKTGRRQRSQSLL